MVLRTCQLGTTDFDCHPGETQCGLYLCGHAQRRSQTSPPVRFSIDSRQLFGEGIDFLVHGTWGWFQGLRICSGRIVHALTGWMSDRCPKGSTDAIWNASSAHGLLATGCSVLQVGRITEGPNLGALQVFKDLFFVQVKPMGFGTTDILFAPGILGLHGGDGRLTWIQGGSR